MSVIVSLMSSMLFCCSVSLLIAPAVFERLFHDVPTLIHYTRNAEVKGKSIPITLGEAFLWIFIVAAVYAAVYFLDEETFRLITISRGAVLSWIYGTVYLLYRAFHVKTIIARRFYNQVYMRFVTTEAKNRYSKFMVQLDSLGIEQLHELLSNKLPPLYRQAAQRHLNALIATGAQNSWGHGHKTTPKSVQEAQTPEATTF